MRCDDSRACRRCRQKGIECIRSHPATSAGDDADAGMLSQVVDSVRRSLPNQGHRQHSETVCPRHLLPLTSSDVTSVESVMCGEDGISTSGTVDSHGGHQHPIISKLPAMDDRGSISNLVSPPIDPALASGNYLFDRLSPLQNQSDFLGFDLGLEASMLYSMAPLLVPGSNDDLEQAAMTPKSLSCDESGVSDEANKTYTATLGSWKPVPGDYIELDKCNLFLSAAQEDSMAGKMGSFDPTVIKQHLTSVKRDQIMYLISGSSHNPRLMPTAASFPSAKILDEMLRIALTRQRDDITPIIHLPTFNPSHCDITLLIALICAGASFSANPLAHKFGLALTEVLRTQVISSGDRENHLTRILPYVQAFVLASEVGLWSGDQRKSEMSDVLSAFPSSILRHSRWYYEQTYFVISPSWAELDDQLELTWMRWSEQESFKRTVYRHFIQCSRRSVFRNSTPQVSYRELSTPIPYHPELWFASSSIEWRSKYLQLQPLGHQPRLNLAHCLARPAVFKAFPPMQDPGLANLAVLSSIMTMMVEDRLQIMVFRSLPDIERPDQGFEGVGPDRYITKLLDETRGLLESDTPPTWPSSPATTFLVVFNTFHSSTPMCLIETLFGNEKHRSAREARIELKEWVRTRLGRNSVWQAAQVLRAARALLPRDRTDFHVFAAYQAIQCLWVYGNIHERELQTQNPTAQDGTAPMLPGDNLPMIRVDGAESLESQRWVSHAKGIPFIPRSSEEIGIPSGRDTDLIPLTASLGTEGSLAESLVGMMKDCFSPTVTGKHFPILEHVCKILDVLGR